MIRLPRAARLLTLGLLATLMVAPLTLAQDATYVPRADGQHVSDQARVFDSVNEAQINDDLLTLVEETGIDLVIYTQSTPKAGNRRARRGAHLHCRPLRFRRTHRHRSR